MRKPINHTIKQQLGTPDSNQETQSTNVPECHNSDNNVWQNNAAFPDTLHTTLMLSVRSRAPTPNALTAVISFYMEYGRNGDMLSGKLMVEVNIILKHFIRWISNREEPARNAKVTISKSSKKKTFTKIRRCF